MTLQEAIRIGLDNSEIVRVIAFGAQGIPIGGFEPTPLNTGASAGVASSLGAGTLQSVYDPAIHETQIATALVELRHRLHHQHPLGQHTSSRSTTACRAARSA